MYSRLKWWIWEQTTVKSSYTLVSANETERQETEGQRDRICFGGRISSIFITVTSAKRDESVLYWWIIWAECLKKVLKTSMWKITKCLKARCTAAEPYQSNSIHVTYCAVISLFTIHGSKRGLKTKYTVRYFTHIAAIPNEQHRDSGNINFSQFHNCPLSSTVLTVYCLVRHNCPLWISI